VKTEYVVAGGDILAVGRYRLAVGLPGSSYLASYPDLLSELISIESYYYNFII
jgi:hypothetical protein